MEGREKEGNWEGRNLRREEESSTLGEKDGEKRRKVGEHLLEKETFAA